TNFFPIEFVLNLISLTTESQRTCHQDTECNGQDSDIVVDKKLSKKVSPHPLVNRSPTLTMVIFNKNRTNYHNTNAYISKQT
ncbi:hypothetical protein Csa_022321, partial [Cucumis sativus]